MEIVLKSNIEEIRKEHGINTAIETTLCVPYDMIEPLIPFIDTFLVDIKHMDSAKHEEFTTMKNELILQNAKRVSAVAKNNPDFEERISQLELTKKIVQYELLIFLRFFSIPICIPTKCNYNCHDNK